MSKELVQIEQSRFGLKVRAFCTGVFGMVGSSVFAAPDFTAFITEVGDYATAGLAAISAAGLVILGIHLGPAIYRWIRAVIYV